MAVMTRANRRTAAVAAAAAADSLHNNNDNDTTTHRGGVTQRNIINNNIINNNNNNGLAVAATILALRQAAISLNNMAVSLLNHYVCVHDARETLDEALRFILAAFADLAAATPSPLGTHHMTGTAPNAATTRTRSGITVQEINETMKDTCRRMEFCRRRQSAEYDDPSSSDDTTTTTSNNNNTRSRRMDSSTQYWPRLHIISSQDHPVRIYKVLMAQAIEDCNNHISIIDGTATRRRVAFPIRIDCIDNGRRTTTTLNQHNVCPPYRCGTISASSLAEIRLECSMILLNSALCRECIADSVSASAIETIRQDIQQHGINNNPTNNGIMAHVGVSSMATFFIDMAIENRAESHAYYQSADHHIVQAAAAPAIDNNVRLADSQRMLFQEENDDGNSMSATTDIGMLLLLRTVVMHQLTRSSIRMNQPLEYQFYRDTVSQCFQRIVDQESVLPTAEGTRAGAA